MCIENTYILFLIILEFTPICVIIYNISTSEILNLTLENKNIKGDYMNKKEIEILKLEETFKDTLENEIKEQQKIHVAPNKKVEIKDIKLVGDVVWKDKINSKDLSERLFIVEKETKEIDSNGNERKTESKLLYLGNECIAGFSGDEIIFKENFKNFEMDKLNAVSELLENTTKEQLEQNSLAHLQSKELAEMLTAHLGRKVSEEEATLLLEKLSKEDKEKIKEEREEQEEENDKDKKEEKEKNNLSEKQAEKIKVNGIQKVDLNKKVDGKETLGKRLDLQGYENLYVIYSDEVDEITNGAKRENTTYSLVGITSDGQAKVLNDEFEIDKTVGNSASREQTKIRANNTASRDNKDSSVFTRKTNGASIGCENDQGHVNMFFYQKTAEENENVGIQIETSQTPVISVQTREIMNRNKGVYQKDKVQDEIQEHTDEDCKLEDRKDFDGDENTSTHIHLTEDELDECVQDILNFESDDGEEKIKEVFTADEVKEKLQREIKNNEESLPLDTIISNVEKEMNADAENLYREHKL